ncbi:MAG: Fic family protein [Truepera sp.]|nr:Fic family protein [Truepera sp.]
MNAQAASGDTPLHHASGFNKSEPNLAVIKVLLDADADPISRDATDSSPWDYARSQARPEDLNSPLYQQLREGHYRDIDIWSPSTGITDLDDPEGLAATEIAGIQAVWRDQQERLKGTRLLADFNEKLSREWAIETGIIENVYEIERGVTETLIEHGFREDHLDHGSTDRPRKFVLRVLEDQKQALDSVFDFVKGARHLSTSYIKELHSALLRSQKFTEGEDTLGHWHDDIPLLKGDWKKQPNYPVRDGVMYKYCPPEQVASEMDRLVEMHAEHIGKGVSAEVQAAWLHHRFTQIHPFQDGNGRVARAITSLVLVKYGLFPLVVTRDDKATYINALEAADEGDLRPLVDLIARLQRIQFLKAAALSETVLSERADVRATLDGLLEAADRTADEKRSERERVSEIAGDLRRDLLARLHSIAPEVERALLRVSPSLGKAWVSEGFSGTGHYFRAQIIENAGRKHLNYYVNFDAELRSWVALNMRWERQSRLVFAIHGIGYQFNGSLICAPFLEFRDRDEEDTETRSTLVPVADGGFIFFHDETTDTALKRFQPWRELALKVALKELAQNL